MFSTDPNEAWEKYGAEDPYFGVVNAAEYKSIEMDDAARASFFNSGEEYMALVMRDAREHLDLHLPVERALDFGCGVGRLLVPLARHCTSVVGVDVSRHMLAEARKNCEARGVTNAEFVKSDGDWPEVDGSFDFVHSFIVFQHIPVRRGEAVLEQMLRRLRSGGVGVLHFTFHRKAHWTRKAVHSLRKTVPLVNQVVNVLQGNPISYPMTQMNEYDLNRLFLLLWEHGCETTFVRLTDHGGHLGAMVFFRRGDRRAQ